MAKRRVQVAGERVERRVRHPEQHLEVGAGAERQQAGARQVGVVDEDARAERERADAAARLRRDDAANLERLRADQELVADAQIELRQQFRPHERAAVAQQRVRVRHAVAQRQRAVERKLRLDGAQLHHLQRRPCRPAAPSSRLSIASDWARDAAGALLALEPLARPPA